MITLKDIRTLAAGREYDAMRLIHDRAKVEGIEGCDDEQLSTLNLCILECSMFKGKSPGHERSLLAMLDAIERGNHPYDDIISMSTLNAEAAIAKATLDSLL